MTNKPLIALGVVTALAMAGGQANAETCTANTVRQLSNLVEESGPCTLGDKTLSQVDFFPDQFGSSEISLSANGPNDSVVVSRPSPQGFLLSYTIAASPGHTFQTASASVTGTGSEAMVGVGMSDLPHPLPPESLLNVNQGNSPFTFSNVMGLTSVAVENRGRGPGVTSFTNAFTQQVAAAAPEPMSLSLFGLGLGGLALARRRRC